MTECSKSLLVCTLGGSWMVVPEAYHYVNAKGHDFYRNHPQYQDMKAAGLVASDRLWIVTSGTTGPDVGKCIEWWKSLAPPGRDLRICSVKDTGQVQTEEENRRMGEGILRMVLEARRFCDREGLKLYLCLAGGRKTMSNYLQKAGNLFGADALIHIVGSFDPQKVKGLSGKDEYDAVKNTYISQVSPMILTPESGFKEVFSSGLDGFRLESCEISEYLEEAALDGTQLLDYTDRRLQEIRNISQNMHFFDSIRDERHENFRSLYMLSKLEIQNLQHSKIGSIASEKDEALRFLRSLPKVDLHCHLGGAASPAELIEVAQENDVDMEKAIKVPLLRDMADILERSSSSAEELRCAIDGYTLSGSCRDSLYPARVKHILTGESKSFGIPLYQLVSAFLLLFKGRELLLETLIFGTLPDDFGNISLERYMELGDFGGSSLLQTRKSLTKAVVQLCRKAAQDNVRYLEIRCSPANYTKGEMSLQVVSEVLLTAALQKSGTAMPKVNFIFSATRHKDLTVMSRQIASAIMYSPELPGRSDESFTPSVVGFDLAGRESRSRYRPSEFRQFFLPLFRNYLRITIHAGEETDETEEQGIENIWEAIYELQADRIGHGLKLQHNDTLRQVIIDRQIAIELCPSSNYQTQHFHDFINPSLQEGAHIYPLKSYLDEGVVTTINTDNWGISRTTLSNEYLKAARMTRGGLSKWEILNLVKAGFKSAFLPFKEKERLLKEADKTLYDLITGTRF